ncbi:GDSL esterase/lipase At5g62930 [Linum perenne]
MRPQIVLFGDSITEQSFRSGGWGASLTDSYSRKADVFNRGYGGYNTRWALFLLHQLFPLDGRKPPIAATVFFGANDAALLGRTSERHCVELAKELGVLSVNLWSKMQETEGWQKKFLTDGLHLTPEGNAVVFQEVRKAFTEAWLSPGDMPFDFPHHSHIDGKNPEQAFEQPCL